ncbi:hypothetical protein AVEN_211992-1 [Araneus ventricosus]|uniref:Uncharacterized protein n=1 Tax=Araneus ventricosus TaxID=182803 RepID=A0A4Y2AQK6_ARAVE|nr:hypothetical protein AVEN_211992-1 [Araneus ventricosus]
MKECYEMGRGRFEEMVGSRSRGILWKFMANSEDTFGKNVRNALHWKQRTPSYVVIGDNELPQLLYISGNAKSTPCSVPGEAAVCGEAISGFAMKQINRAIAVNSCGVL